MSKSELLVPIGLPASGKTSMAREWQAEDPDARIRVNYDELRIGMFREGWVWNRKDEEAMKAQARRIVKDALTAGLSVVVDNTNLSRYVRSSWQDFARDLGAEYIEQDMMTPLEECIHRDRRRGEGTCTCNTDDADDSFPVVKGSDGNLHDPACPLLLPSTRVGQAVIDRMALEYGFIDWGMRLFNGKEVPDARPIAIVDIDGTVADCGERLRHLEWKIVHKMDCTSIHTSSDIQQCHQCSRKQSKNWPAFFAEVSQDKPIIQMINLITKLEPDHMIVYLSGRPISSNGKKIGIMTEDWLGKYLMRIDRLFLRQDNDHRPDFEYKRAVLEHLPLKRVAYIFEDRDRNVRMFRDELRKAGSDGLVMQVAEGSY